MEFVEHLRVADPPMVGDGGSGVTLGHFFFVSCARWPSSPLPLASSYGTVGTCDPHHVNVAARLRRMARPAGLEPATP